MCVCVCCDLVAYVAYNDKKCLCIHASEYFVWLKILTFEYFLFIIFLVRSTACIKLEEYQTAKAALEKGASLAPEDSRFLNLIDECNDRIAGNCIFES